MDLPASFQRDAIDGVPVAELARRFGSPLFVFSEATLRATFREAQRAFAARHPDVRFAWSYKTNYLNALCRVFHQEGALAEVVSDFEYAKARHNGVPGRDIVFNGPYKSREILQRAAGEGALIQIDNLEELRLLGEIAAQPGGARPVAVGLRVYLDTGTHPVWSKFGFNAEDGEALRVAQQIARMPGLALQGFHAHIGTFILEPAAYGRTASVLARLALEAEKLGAGPIRYLNCGGGFASRARLRCQTLPPEQVTPSFDRYAAAICDALQQAWPAGRSLPRLYLETGRALVDEAGYLVATVVALKRRPAAGTEAGHAAIVLDAGINLLYTAAWQAPDIFPAQAATGASAPTTVYGCLCMNIDVIREDAPLPALTAGDHLVIHPVGAYNLSQSPPFITYRPAVVLIAADGGPHLIRRREDLRYLQELEEMPAHLAPPPSAAPDP